MRMYDLSISEEVDEETEETIFKFFQYHNDTYSEVVLFKRTDKNDYQLF